MRLSTLMVTSFAVAATGVLESKETRAWVGVEPSWVGSRGSERRGG